MNPAKLARCVAAVLFLAPAGCSTELFEDEESDLAPTEAVDEEELTSTVTIPAEADAYVRSGSYATQNFGQATAINVDASHLGTVEYGYLRFRIGSLAGKVSRARVRLYALDGSANSAEVRAISNAGWSETGITWNTKPAMDGALVASLGSISRGTWASVDVTSVIAADSVLSLGLKPKGNDGLHVASREASANRPKLLIDLVVPDAGQPLPADAGIPAEADAGTLPGPSDAGCQPTSCAAQGKDCGTSSDGCGGTLACGDCTGSQTCGGGGRSGVCGTLPAGPRLYVATSGNDSNSGTSPSSPKKTLGAALAAASPGYTISVAPGTYSGNLITTKGGTSGQFITLRSEVKHGATLYGNGDTSNQSAVEIKHRFIRLQDFTITGAKGVRNGVLINANDVEVIGNHIHTICQFLTGGTSWQGGAGVDIWNSPASNILIDGNLIHHIGAPGSTQQLVHGMYLGVHVTNGRVTNNLIYKCEDFGLHPYDATEASGWQFINNTITACGRGILQAPSGVTRNNISYDNRSSNYDIRGSGNVLSNNLSGGSGDVRMSGVTSGVNPLFVNPAFDGTGDFRLKPGSPAIDKGTSNGAPAADFAGTPRPQGGGVDIGAYEQ